MSSNENPVDFPRNVVLGFLKVFLGGPSQERSKSDAKRDSGVASPGLPA